MSLLFQTNAQDFVRSWAEPRRQATRAQSFWREGRLGGFWGRRLAGLEMRGPGQVVPGAPTVRAGGESDYQFRVQRQREAQAREERERWQKAVLEALQKLVRDGEVAPDQLYLKQLEFGNVPGVGVVP